MAANQNKEDNYTTFQLALIHHGDSYHTSNNQYPAYKTIIARTNLIKL